MLGREQAAPGRLDFIGYKAHPKKGPSRGTVKHWAELPVDEPSLAEVHAATKLPGAIAATGATIGRRPSWC